MCEKERLAIEAIQPQTITVVTVRPLYPFCRRATPCGFVTKNVPARSPPVVQVRGPTQYDLKQGKTFAATDEPWWHSVETSLRRQQAAIRHRHRWDRLRRNPAPMSLLPHLDRRGAPLHAPP